MLLNFLLGNLKTTIITSLLDFTRELSNNFFACFFTLLKKFNSCLYLLLLTTYTDLYSLAQDSSSFVYLDDGRSARNKINMESNLRSLSRPYCFSNNFAYGLFQKKTAFGKRWIHNETIASITALFSLNFSYTDRD